MTNDAGATILNIEFEDNNQPETPKPETAKVKSAGVQKKVLFGLVLCAIIAIPVGSAIYQKSQKNKANVQPQTNRPTVAQSSLAPPLQSVRTQETQLDINSFLGEQGRQRLSQYPKTQVEREREQLVNEAIQREKDALTAQIAQLAQKEQQLDEEIAILRLLREDFSSAINAMTQSSRELTDATDDLQVSTERLEKIAVGNGIMNATGRVVDAPVSVIPLSAYVVRSRIGNTVVVSRRNVPGSFVRLQVGSELPGHGAVLSIDKTAEGTIVKFANGMIG